MNTIDVKSINIDNCADAIRHTRFNAIKMICTALFSMYLTTSLLYFIFGIPVINVLPTLFGVAAVIILLRNGVSKEDVQLYVYTGILFASFIVSSLMVGRTGSRLIAPCIFIVSSFGIAMILIREYVSSWGGYLVFYGLSGYFLILILAGYDGPSALPLTSHNGISITMLVACISFYILRGLENRGVDIKPALITVIISIWGVGRSGIVSSIFLLSGLLYFRFKDKSKYASILYVFALLALFIGSYIFFDVLVALAIKSSFFSKAIETSMIRMAAGESPRMAMLENYFNNLDFYRLIFGVNVLEDPWPEGEMNEYNYHNSFINLHLQTGFMGLFTMALLFFAVVKFYRTNKVFLVLLLTLILRSSTDLFIFFSRFDFMPLFFIFYFLKSKQRFPFRMRGFLRTIRVENQRDAIST